MLIVFLLIFLTALYLYFKFSRKRESLEGFTQDTPYVLKRGADVYDDFYAQIYDTVRPIDETAIPAIVKLSVKHKKDARFLVIRCKTGDAVGQLAKSSIKSVGLDSSSPAIRVAKQKNPDCEFRIADPTNPMIYDAAQFTHILCLDFGIYEMDHQKFFKNAQQWLPVGGDLVIHLVDPDKFTIATAAERRVTQKVIEYPDFTYKSKWEFHLPKVTVKETFTDRESQNVRENEIVLDMPEANAVLVDAGKYGFIVKRSFPLKDKHQFVYIMERTQ